MPGEGEQLKVFLPHPYQWAWSKGKVIIRIVYGVSIQICIYGEYTSRVGGAIMRHLALYPYNGGKKKNFSV